MSGNARITSIPFERSVFVNCPFDNDYLPILQAIVFAIHDCEFVARSAVEATKQHELRIDKITRLVGESQFSIHDISRIQITADSPLPRFNMPFECGLALGAVRYGRRKGRDFLLLSGAPFSEKQTLSDLAGQDAISHGNDPNKAIAAVRRFLASKSATPLRGAKSICNRYERMSSEMPDLARALDLELREVLSFDYLPEFITLAVEWIAAHGS